MTDAVPLLALLAAYVNATGLKLTLSYQRQQILAEIHERGITPEDVTAVMKDLARKVASRDERAACYTPACLSFSNAMGNVDRLEERIALVKQAQARKPRPLKQVGVTVNGITRMVEDESTPDPKVIDLPDALTGLAREIKAKQATA